MPKPGTDLALSGPVRLRSRGCFPGVAGTSYRKPSGASQLETGFSLHHITVWPRVWHQSRDHAHMYRTSRVLEGCLRWQQTEERRSHCPSSPCWLLWSTWVPVVGGAHAKRESYHTVACGLVLNLGTSYNIRERNMGSL